MLYSEKGDIMLNAAVAVDPVIETGPGFGGELGLELGVNEYTDFQLNIDYLISQDFISEDGILNNRYYVASYYTPYFGEIRPRIGGSLGLIYIDDEISQIDEVLFFAGFHIQGIMNLSDFLNLYGDISPKISFGKGGGFSTVIKIGLQFRLTK
jgi:hypothetical protein